MSCSNRYNGKIISQYTDKYGYLFCNLFIDGKIKSKKVHRLVADSFIDNPLSKEQVNHINLDKKNNFYKNLEWVTLQENINHARLAGRYKSNVGSFKKGDGLILPIRIRTIIRYLRKKNPKKYKSVLFQRKFNVSKSTIYSIVHGKV